MRKEAENPKGPQYWTNKLLAEAELPPRRRPGDLPAGFPARGGPGLRVGLISPCLYQGGAEAVMLMQARAIDPAKISWLGCAVVGSQVDPGMRAALEVFMPVATGQAAAIALARECDVLIVWAIDGLPAILAESRSRAKVISVVHAPPESPWGQTVYAKTAGIDQWIAVSELARDVIPEASQTIPISVIWNAVDVTRLEVKRDRDTMRRAWGVPPGAKVAGYLGRLSAEKDPHAMRRMIDHLPSDWHAVLVGTGAEAIEPHPRLHLVGNDPAAGDCLDAFDALVVPSHYESFGLTIAEGIWMGIPVVSTDVGIARLHPGLTRIVPIGADGPTLAAAVLEAHASGPMPGSREWAREHLAPDRFGREWTDLVVSMVPAPAKPPGLLTMAASFGRAVVAHALDGGRKASPEVQAERLATCRACPKLDQEQDRCLSCGCLAMDLKRSWASSECPDGRWGAASI